MKRIETYVEAYIPQLDQTWARLKPTIEAIIVEHQAQLASDIEVKQSSPFTVRICASEAVAIILAQELPKKGLTLALPN